MDCTLFSACFSHWWCEIWPLLCEQLALAGALPPGCTANAASTSEHFLLSGNARGEPGSGHDNRNTWTNSKPVRSKLTLRSNGMVLFLLNPVLILKVLICFLFFLALHFVLKWLFSYNKKLKNRRRTFGYFYKKAVSSLGLLELMVVTSLWMSRFFGFLQKIWTKGFILRTLLI